MRTRPQTDKILGAGAGSSTRLTCRPYQRNRVELEGAVTPEVVGKSEYEAADALVEASGLPLDDLDQCRATQFMLRDGAMVLELPRESA